MVKGKLGGIRRGQVLRSNGPGSVIDFRSKKGGIVGVIPTFIDKWPAAHIKNKKNWDLFTLIFLNFFGVNSYDNNSYYCCNK